MRLKDCFVATCGCISIIYCIKTSNLFISKLIIQDYSINQVWSPFDLLIIHVIWRRGLSFGVNDAKQ